MQCNSSNYPYSNDNDNDSENDDNDNDNNNNSLLTYFKQIVRYLQVKSRIKNNNNNNIYRGYHPADTIS